jgi:hypothetical protein
MEGRWELSDLHRRISSLLVRAAVDGLYGRVDAEVGTLRGYR